jgi:hypothetical protein
METTIYLLSKENRGGHEIPVAAYTSKDAAMSRAENLIYLFSTPEDREGRRIEVNEYTGSYTTLSLDTVKYGELYYCVREVLLFDRKEN